MSHHPTVQLFNEDCRETINRNLQYDYVITSPPDFAELDVPPDSDVWYDFLCDRIYNVEPKHGLATIFVSDRRYKGETIAKDVIIENVFGDRMFLSHKIWVKSYKTNLYRPNFTHILTFGEKKHRPTKPMPDVFFDEFHPIGDYTYNFSLDIVKKFILAYTDEGDTVFDPFIGSGTIALACLQTGRNCIGVELNTETYGLCMQRVLDEQRTTQQMVAQTWSTSNTDSVPKEVSEESKLETFFGNQ